MTSIQSLVASVVLLGLVGCNQPKATTPEPPTAKPAPKPTASLTDDPAKLRDELAAKDDDTGVRPPRQAKLYGGKTTEKICALTFDDGPKPEWTEKLLAVLKEADVKATFFLVGKQVVQYPELTKKIADAGHIVGNHTFTHPQGDKNMATMDEDEVAAEMKGTCRAVQDATGVRPKYFRPAGGHVNSLVINTSAANGMMSVFGGPNGDDTNPKKTAEMVEKEIMKVKPGGIVWLHTGSQQTLDCLPRFLAKLKADGWKIVTLDDLAKIARSD
ncbi:MAG: polysaccharide deacetylase family protein [Armatimonadetes bacterium]|nr:polysaccharide deacetylase family protein [Armatimonadota bacterium]